LIKKGAAQYKNVSWAPSLEYKPELVPKISVSVYFRYPVQNRIQDWWAKHHTYSSHSQCYIHTYFLHSWIPAAHIVSFRFWWIVHTRGMCTTRTYHFDISSENLEKLITAYECFFFVLRLHLVSDSMSITQCLNEKFSYIFRKQRRELNDT
jgi:hypothetical protein